MGSAMSASKDEQARAIGQKVKRFREARRMSSQELAEAIGTTSSAYISRIENGRIYPSIPTLAKIARALGVLTSDLLPDEEPSPSGLITTAYLRSQGLSGEDAEKIVAMFRQLDEEVRRRRGRTDEGPDDK